MHFWQIELESCPLLCSSLLSLTRCDTLTVFIFSVLQVLRAVILERMRAVIQRVVRASVRRKADQEEINSIQNGLLIFIGIHRDDKVYDDVDWMVKKILNLKLFDDEAGGRWKCSVKEMNYEILCISQFTLNCTLKGTKPDFHHSMLGPESQPVYELLLQRLGVFYNHSKIQRGFFGVSMLIDSEMDGPVTITIDSPVRNSPSQNDSSSVLNE